MDPESKADLKAAPRKVKFAPKAPPKREIKPVVPKPEKIENDIDAAAQEQLLRRLHESSKVKPKHEQKGGAAQVAPGHGSSSKTITSFGSSKGDVNKKKVEKEYKEPWDYYTHYPVTLPLRRPYSGDPESLDREEFGEDSETVAHDDYATNPAAELGLMDQYPQDNMFFIQLPASMPMLEQSVKPENHEQGTTKSVRGAGPSKKPCNLDGLPAGLMGKLLVYKSGAVKLKLGDTLYDVSSGLDSVFAQEVVAMNTDGKHCCSIGEVNKRIVITPDFDSILDKVADL